MRVQQFMLEKRRAMLYAGQNHCDTLLYLHGEPLPSPLLEQLLENNNAGIVFLPDTAWNRELSPFPAPKVFARGEDFQGGAALYLTELTGKIIPAIERELPSPPVHRGIAGYSLAGLFAIYALYHSQLFSRGASVSGSLWFDGFLEDIMEKMIPQQVEKVYFSLGLREKHSRNPRMARVEQCTDTLYRHLQAHGVKTILEYHPGGHFQDIPQRIFAGLDWTLR